MADQATDAITDDERAGCCALEDVMGKIHRVTDALRMIDSPRYPPGFKQDLRARLPVMRAEARAALRSIEERL